MAILDINTPKLGTSETADGRFFDAFGASSLSHEFWKGHEDLFPSGYGVVMSTGVTAEGSWVNIGDKRGVATRSFTFDGRDNASGAFTWYVQEAVYGEGRTLFELVVGQNTARQFSFDAQGRLLRVTAADPQTILSEVEIMLQHPATASHIADLNERKVAAGDQLSRVETAARDFGERRRNEEIKKANDSLGRVGFTALLPISRSIRPLL